MDKASLPSWLYILGTILTILASWKVGDTVVAFYRLYQERRKPAADIAYLGAQTAHEWAETKQIAVKADVDIITQIYSYAQQLRTDNEAYRLEVAELKRDVRTMQLDNIAQASEMVKIRSEHADCQAKLEKIEAQIKT